MAKVKTCKSCGVELPYSERNGIKSYIAKYGYGLNCGCYNQWLISDDPKAQETFQKFLIKNKKDYQKKVAKKQREQKKAKKLSIMSPDKYRAKYVQPLINKIARLIDYGHPCIATELFGKMNGGHYTSVGANRTICLNLHNIFIQSFQSNHWKSGDEIKYRRGLLRVFGEDYVDFIESLGKCPPIKLTKDDLIEIKGHALDIIKELESDKKMLTPSERIAKRNECNLRLGIYPHEFSQFSLANYK